jgi:CO/xanthine dehydrogenase FAD-binding subunit
MTTVLLPRSVAMAESALENPEASVVGGGTWLVPQWLTTEKPAVIVSLRRVRGAANVGPNGCGAAVTGRQLRDAPVPAVLRQAAESLVRPGILNAVTLAGNIVAPGPRCLAAALLALDGVGRCGDVWHEVDELMDAPPRLLTALRWSTPLGSAFTKLRDRPSGGAVLATASVARFPAHLRIVVGGGTLQRPRLCRGAEAAWTASGVRHLTASAVGVLEALEDDLKELPSHQRAASRVLVGRGLQAVLAAGGGGSAGFTGLG